MHTLSLPELRQHLADALPPVLVEALPERYFQQGHLPNAVNINVGEVTAKAAALLPKREQAIVVYCASQACANSDQVAAQLRQLGYASVSVFKGGKAEWLEAGLALEGLPV